MPSSIVGDSAGILSSIAISSSPPARRCTVRPASGSGASSANFAASTTMSLISLSIALSSSSLDAQLLQLLGGMVDRVVMLAIVLHFLARPVLGRVGHRVAAIAIGLQLEDDRALARLRSMSAPLRPRRAPPARPCRRPGCRECGSSRRACRNRAPTPSARRWCPSHIGCSRSRR